MAYSGKDYFILIYSREWGIFFPTLALVEFFGC